MEIMIKIDPDQADQIVGDAIQEAIKIMASFYDYKDYPPDVEKQMAALSTTYYYFMGEEAFV
jgi:hypothetical protein